MKEWCTGVPIQGGQQGTGRPLLGHWQDDRGKAKNRLYPNFPNVSFLLYTVVSGADSILYGSKVGWDLRWHIKVPYHKKNDIGKGFQCTKSAGSVFGYFDYAVQPLCNSIG